MSSSGPLIRSATGAAPVIRLRLLRRLDDTVLRHRLTTIVAGPGTGKTTLLGQWAAGTRAVWHTAVPGESEAALMHSLIDGLDRLDDVAEVTSPDSELSMAADVLASLSPDENPARADALGAALTQHVARRVGDEHLVLIVDDAHVLGTVRGGGRTDRRTRSSRARPSARRPGLAGHAAVPHRQVARRRVGR